MNTSTHKLCCAITHQDHNFDDVLAKLPLKFWHGYVIAPVMYFTYKVNHSLVVPPLKFNDGLAIIINVLKRPWNKGAQVSLVNDILHSSP